MYSISDLLRARIPGISPFRHACTRYQTFDGRCVPISAFSQMAGHRPALARRAFGSAVPGLRVLPLGD